jgi:hypothetical protein
MKMMMERRWQQGNTGGHQGERWPLGLLIPWRWCWCGGVSPPPWRLPRGGKFVAIVRAPIIGFALFYMTFAMIFGHRIDASFITGVLGTSRTFLSISFVP